MHIPIDPASADPIYEQIRSGIAEAIARGDLAAGDALPSIRALARDLRVSVITTTRAYNELVADGLVASVQGKGVFVREQDPASVRARALDRLAGQLAEAARTARRGGIGPDALHELLSRAIEEDS
ncbi:GntR family transcriptional regulator [Brachybacterium huguangmaarense]|uniref:GntR family transcriptional regulator n=1 Tax=Brachybacterium huguangmaarense TaxID=1652028 RepID=A0ABY6G257_9MICO|nr:GntR family transcriptional regulator [Brachybacterium huguangmaarense]UYG17187.1 GntR family transcriptional regulator [Brachybacterium huguangmaarense]